MNINYEKDEQLDGAYLAELLHKEKNHMKVADELSKWFTKKYGSEFSGFVKVETDLVSGAFILHFGKEKQATIEKDAAETIPEVVRKNREEKAGVIRKITTAHRGKHVPVQDILDGKI